MENGSDYLGIPLDAKQDLLLGLHDATAIELPDDWEGATPMQIMKQLASSWRIDVQQLINQGYIDCRHMGQFHLFVPLVLVWPVAISIRDIILGGVEVALC